MIELQIIGFILLAHFLADFVLQTDEMALKKSKSNKWLTYHCLTYSIPFMVVIFFIFDDLKYGIIWVWLNVVLHWVTDYITSRWTAILWSKQKRHEFFVVIGGDQLIHHNILFVSYYYLV